MRGGILKRCFFIGSSRRDIKAFPEAVRDEVGHALYLAQRGEEAHSAKAMKGFGGRGVLEIVEDFDGDTYRRYTRSGSPRRCMCFMSFRRNPNEGIATPKQELELIKRRLKDAEADYRERFQAADERPGTS